MSTAEAPPDLNVPDPKKPCVPLPELVAIVCPECNNAGECTACDGLGSVLVDRALLKVWE